MSLCFRCKGALRAVRHLQACKTRVCVVAPFFLTCVALPLALCRPEIRSCRRLRKWLWTLGVGSGRPDDDAATASTMKLCLLLCHQKRVVLCLLPHVRLVAPLRSATSDLHPAWRLTPCLRRQPERRLRHATQHSHMQAGWYRRRSWVLERAGKR